VADDVQSEMQSTAVTNVCINKLKNCWCRTEDSHYGNCLLSYVCHCKGCSTSTTEIVCAALVHRLGCSWSHQWPEMNVHGSLQVKFDSFW